MRDAGAPRSAPRAIVATIASLAILALARAAHAHGGEDHGPAAAAVDAPAAAAPAALAWDVATAAVLLVAALGYLIARTRLPRAARPGPARTAAMLLGLAVVGLALLGPLAAASDVWFSAHMGQHELLILVAAPLIVLARPEVVWWAALPRPTRARLAATRVGGAALRAGRVLGNAWLVVALHAALLWVWHAPVLFEAALHHEWVHVVQHLGFFATAALFWRALVRGRYGRYGYGMAVLFVFATALHSGLLGALLAFAGATVYPTHAARTGATGGDPLADQQLAGFLMWIPAGVILLALGLALFLAWFGAIERRAARHDAPAARA